MRTNSRASTFNDPVQQNEDDCGAFICGFAENLAQGREWGNFNFQQKDIPKIRRKITYELKASRLM